MATHRRAKAASRAVVSLTATTTAMAAAGVVLSPASGRAVSTADVKSQVAALDAQAEQATNVYDQAMEQLAALQKQVDDLQAEAAATQRSMTRLLSALGPMAAAQYRQGSIDPGLELLLNGNPDTYLQKAQATNRAVQSQAAALKSLKLRKIQLAALQKEAADPLAPLEHTPAP